MEPTKLTTILSCFYGGQKPFKTLQKPPLVPTKFTTTLVWWFIKPYSQVVFIRFYSRHKPYKNLEKPFIVPTKFSHHKTPENPLKIMVNFLGTKNGYCNHFPKNLIYHYKNHIFMMIVFIWFQTAKIDRWIIHYMCFMVPITLQIKLNGRIYSGIQVVITELLINNFYSYNKCIGKHTFCRLSWKVASSTFFPSSFIKDANQYRSIN